MERQFTVRRYHGGGLGNLKDSGIPLTEVEVYIRDSQGNLFHVPTLYEGLQHLLSNEGYRLSVYQWPDGAGDDRERYGLTIRREGNELTLNLQAPNLISSVTPEEGYVFNKVIFDLEDKPAIEGGDLTKPDLETVIVLPERVELPIQDEITVTVDGT